MIKPIDETIIRWFAELYPNSAFTDVETALDLMAAEIKTLRLMETYRPQIIFLPQQLMDSVLLDFLEKRWAKVEMLGDPNELAPHIARVESGWEVTPERYNPAHTGEGGTLRDAIRDAIRRNSTERQDAD